MSLRPSIKNGDDYLSKLIQYIPAEVQAFYVFVSGLISSAPENEQFSYFKFIFIALLIVTPLWIFLAISSGNTIKSSQNLRIYQSVVALFSIAIWIYNINMIWVVQFFGGKIPNSPVFGSILLALFTLLVPILEKLFVKNPYPKPSITKI
jgi:hypothetical protein